MNKKKTQSSSLATIIQSIIVILLLFMSPAGKAQEKARSTKPSDFKPVGDDVDSKVEVQSKKKPKDAADANTEEPVDEKKPELKPNEEMISGTVNVIRKITMTEVFFKDLKESYFIAPGSASYGVFRALEQSRKTGKPVAMKVNKKSRQIISIDEAGTGKAGKN
ncbi:MAG: hypothetical protein EOP06_28145 [Proteobacteria bacterium]|nr:MAG: hypothetical protein EOP06_28145 [Pseudomonadota bacterium]